MLNITDYILFTGGTEAAKQQERVAVFKYGGDTEKYTPLSKSDQLCINAFEIEASDTFS